MDLSLGSLAGGCVLKFLEGGKGGIVFWCRGLLRGEIYVCLFQFWRCCRESKRKKNDILHIGIFRSFLVLLDWGACVIGGGWTDQGLEASCFCF